MADYWYERLSVQDSSFLVFEDPHTHMHVGGVAILEAGPLATPDGGIDIDRMRTYIASRLPWIPRYRQRLAFVPFVNYPVWVDDDHFNLKYHVRHTSLPRPGGARQLRHLAGRILSQQLDRGKPLWEAWIVEGLEGGGFAFITKAHHCMVDGIASVDLVSVLMSPDPSTTSELTEPWRPRPAPTPWQLLRDDLLSRTRVPADLVRGLRAVVEDLQHTRDLVTEQVGAALELVRSAARLPSATPLNRPIGPHRRFDWLTLDLSDVKDVKNRLGGTVNDVVLATVAGAVRRYLLASGVDVRGLDYRTVVPVSVRAPAEHGAMGNRVSAWLASLPIDEDDPVRRLARVHAITADLKASKQALGTEALIKLGEWAGYGLMTLGVRLAARLHPFNLIVTNVPGPQVPLYMLGAKLLEGYPCVPLFESQTLGVALFSYVGKLCWGFNADWDQLQNLHDFVEATAASFHELHAAALRERTSVGDVTPSPQRRRRTARDGPRRTPHRTTRKTRTAAHP